MSLVSSFGGDAAMNSGSPATRQVVELLGFASPKWMGNALAFLFLGLGAFGVARTFSLVHIVRSHDLAALHAWATGSTYTFEAVMLLLCPFLVRLNRNIRAFGESPENSTLRLIGICLVPITNMVLPYFALKDIWQGTRGRSLALPWWLSLFWLAVLIVCVGPPALVHSFAAEMLAAPAALIQQIAFIAGASIVMVVLVGIVVIRRLAHEQQTRYESLPLSFAEPRV